jgi:signal transduction histidine kinase
VRGLAAASRRPKLVGARAGGDFPVHAADPWPSMAQAPGRAAGMAHDARNLLAAVGLYCELLASPGVLSPRFRHYAQDLRRVGETGARLVATLARGGPDMPARAHAWIEDLGAETLALKNVLESLAGRGVRIEIERAPCSGGLFLTSEDLLRILFNLVSNAVEAMRPAAERDSDRRAEPGARRALRTPGLIRIAVQRGGGASFLPGSHPAAREAGTVLLSVRDNGPGIAPADLPRIFDPGFSTRPDARDSGLDSRLDPGGGRGMGLAIVRGLVESAGGSVRAVSTPGAGARFDIELPLRSSVPLAAGPQSVAGEGKRKGWSKKSCEISSTSEKKGAYNARNFRS